MGYDIYIGQAVNEEDPETLHVWECVEKVEHPDAPVLEVAPGEWPDISGKTNGRHPGYSQMSEWARSVGLYDMWFDKEKGLLRRHPGRQRLLPSHLQQVREALACNPDDFRLKWYAFWMNWALSNCSKPAVENT